MSIESDLHLRASCRNEKFILFQIMIHQSNYMSKFIRTIRRFVEDGPILEIPNVGKSSGDVDLDDATKKWRMTNTLQDEKFIKYVESLKQQESIKESKPLDKESKIHVNKETGEIGGPKGAEPTRYSDWERNGRCFDF
jgi:hypothetical protein